jgi:subtilisin family serine protease
MGYLCTAYQQHYMKHPPQAFNLLSTGSTEIKQGGNIMAQQESTGKGKIVQSQPEPVTPNLDPHLQDIILRVKAGHKIDASFGQVQSDGTVMVDVLAELHDPGAPVSGLNISTTIGSIVTGTVKAEDLEKVRQNPNVISLKRGAKIRPQLQFSVSEINASQEILHHAFRQRSPALTGTGIIIGVVDYGCDFRHNNFRHADGTTRLLFLWDQTGGLNSASPEPYKYGREFSAECINAALQTANPYIALQYEPEQGAHGTHVLDIAAGNGRATGRPGVAPEADLIFVQMPLEHDDTDDVANEDERVFGNSKKLVDAVNYIFRKATLLGKPAVVNISLGMHGGPHDGSTLAERAFDTLLREPGRAMTIAAGNSWQHRSHASGSVTKDAAVELEWIVPENDPTTNELEVWYSGSAKLAVSLITPEGDALAPVALGSTVTLTVGPSTFAGRIIHRAHDSANHDNHVDIFLNPQVVPSGSWRVRLTTITATAVAFHAWIERDDVFIPLTQSRFAEAQQDPTHTLGSIACGELPIVVGSYLSGDTQHPISPFSSEGPTRTGRQKPDISAPGQWLEPFEQYGILAAQAKSQGSIRMSGTSMAAPHVAGVVALVFQAARRPLSIQEIRSALMQSARTNLPLGHEWHPRFGFGHIDAVGAINAVMATTPQPGAVIPTKVRENLPLTNDTLHATDSVWRELLVIVAQSARVTGMKIRIQIEAEAEKTA